MALGQDRQPDQEAGPRRVAPGVQQLQSEMGGERRRMWLAAALYHLGRGASFADAEDALQEFILEHVPALCRNYKSTKGTFDGYLRDAFRYFCWARRRSENRRHIGHVAIETELPSGDIEIRIADESVIGAGELLEAKRLKSILENALGELTQVQRDCWVAAEVHHLTYEEAAQALGITVDLFTISLHRARQRISELVRHYPLSFLLPSEIRDWSGLCHNLRRDGIATVPTVGKRIWDLAPVSLRNAAQDVAQIGGTELQDLIARELNEIFGRTDFYSARHVGTIPPGRHAAEIKSLIKRPQGRMSARRLNKLLFKNHYEQFFEL